MTAAVQAEDPGSKVLPYCLSAGTDNKPLSLLGIAGYGFARLDFPGKRALFVFVLLGLAIPEQAVILPQHRLRALNIYAMYPSRRFLDAKTRTWVEFLKAELPPLLRGDEAVLDDERYWATPDGLLRER